jgi:hypothetical protein
MAEDAGEISKNSLGWKQKLARAVGIGAVVAGSGAVIANRFENNVNDPDFGQPLENSQSFEASLMHSKNEKQEDVPPVFREKPSDTSHELTIEELKDRGIDPSSGKVRVKEVYGQTYASDSKSGFVENEQTGKNHGIWGEIVVSDPQTGQDKPTGIFLSENFLHKNEPPQGEQSK